jgi:predicted metalloprotease with PDZ domain
MKKYIFFIICSPVLFLSCSTPKKIAAVAPESVLASIDLVNVPNDKVTVTITAPALNSGNIAYQLPKIIPGTYAIADYGRYVENFKAFDKAGKLLPVSTPDSNTWVISQSAPLAKITYEVNDTYDSEEADAFEEGSKTIFSPAGTNILAGKQFMLNLCGFVGYFSDKKETTYKLSVSHPQNLQGATSMNDEDTSNALDLFTVPRYAELVDHPIMYAEPNMASTKIGNMEVLLSVYSPRNKNISAASLFPGLEKMLRAQKAYLGDINQTKKYTVLAYITTYGKDDARGIGALEHNTSTTSVFQESMRSRDLVQVISHEFFHTLTPLNVHSREIQDFDFNTPKMSAHLWMYEGVTEYFANHFQVHQGLIKEDKFFALMAEKVKYAAQMYDDNLSMMEMSKNVLEPDMKAQYPNVYQKGALIGMCLDIMLRDSSGGKAGVLDLMARLSKKYGPDKPFDDDKLIGEITSMTNAEVGRFLQEHVVKGTPIDYESYLKRVGVERVDMKEATPIVFIAGGKPYLSVDTGARKAIAVIRDTANNFMNAMGVKNGDEIIEMNGIAVDASNPMNVLMAGYGLEEGDAMTMKVKRNGQIIELKGTVKLNYVDGSGFKFTDPTKVKKKDAWLKGN